MGESDLFFATCSSVPFDSRSLVSNNSHGKFNSLFLSLKSNILENTGYWMCILNKKKYAGKMKVFLQKKKQKRAAKINLPA